MDVIGIVPAAGGAVRLGPLPCSKEILPVGVRRSETGECRISVLGEFLLDEFSRARIDQAYLIINSRKTDIAEYFGTGERYGLHLSYVSVESRSTAASVSAAYARIRGKVCALGFPDVLYPPCDPYSKMIAALEQTSADIVLGLFPTEHPRMMDMVRCHHSGRVESILVKPESVPAGYDAAWINAVWRPRFSDFLHDNLKRLAHAGRRASAGDERSDEVYLGDVIMAAMDEGMVAHGIPVSDHPSLDAGTPETYALAVARFGSLLEPPR